MKQKLLASAMALAMVLSLTPVTALAAEGEDTTLPEEEITVQTETPAEEIPVEEPAEPETPAEEPVEPEVPVEEVTETENTITLSGNISGSYTITEPSTIVVQGNAVLTKADGDADNAFTINANTTLEFDSGASLTLSGYTNGFVVSNATLSSDAQTGGDWNITDGSTIDGTGIDLFRLKTGGKLEINRDVTLTGDGKDNTESRAIVLESGSGQAVTLAAGTTLAANNFYRGMETGGASDYTISGAGMNISEFDFSGNNCGMALSYFDSNARFENCTLEVSNCDASGIFMRQDNAALDGLYIDNVKINCVNDTNLNQSDIAIRFHSNNFEISDSIINIENAWNTGLWIFDGWNANEQNKITDTEITVKNVEAVADSALYGNTLRSKAITVVPYRPWLISGCTITMEGSGTDTSTQGGLNIANGTTINRNGFNVTAVPSMCGGTIILEDTQIYTENLAHADIGVQVGQFLTIGANTVIENDHKDAGWTEHFTVLCDAVSEKYPVRIGNFTLRIDYNTTNMTDAQMVDERVTVAGGSYWSSSNKDLTVNGIKPYTYSLPVNAYDDELKMFCVSDENYASYMPNGTVELKSLSGTSYSYSASEKAAGDNCRYIWAPAVTVTLIGTDSTTSVEVPCGAVFGLTQTLEQGNWTTEDGEAFTVNTLVTEDMTVTVG